MYNRKLGNKITQLTMARLDTFNSIVRYQMVLKCDTTGLVDDDRREAAHERIVVLQAKLTRMDTEIHRLTELKRHYA